MATIPVPAPEAQASIGAFGRVLGVLFSPGKTFEDIVKKPSWMLPIVLTTILSIAVSFSINQRINWREFMNQQIEKSPRAAQMSAEQKQQQIEGGAKFSPVFTYGIGLLGPILGALVVGLVMWGAYSLLGGVSTNFGTAFSVTSHAFLTGLVSSPLFILILYLKILLPQIWRHFCPMNRQSGSSRCVSPSTFSRFGHWSYWRLGLPL